MSVHDIRWEQGAAHVDVRRAAKHFAALPRDPLVRAGLANTLLFALVAVAAEMVLGFFLALFVSRVVGGTRRLPHDLPAADPDPRHRHRRDLEADVQPRLRRHQPAARRSSGSPGSTGSASSSLALAVGDRRRHLALDAVRVPAAARRARVAAAGHVTRRRASTAPAPGRSCATSRSR